MKKNIFTYSIYFLLLSLVLSSCAKKQLAFKAPEPIEWYSKSSETLSNTNSVTEEVQVIKTPEIVVSNLTASELKNHLKSSSKTKENISSVNQETKETKISRSDKKQIRKELKQIVKSEETEINTLLLVLIAILLPPIAVGLVRGWTSGAFFLNILLTLLFYIPGLIHALVVIFSR